MTTSAPDILVVGNASIDHVFRTRSGLLPGSKIQALSMASYAGGQAGNAAHTFAVLGFSVRFVSAVGDDAGGEMLQRAMQRVGVDLAGSTVTSSCPSNTAVVVVDEETGERSIVMYKDPRLAVQKGAVDLAWHESLRLLYLDGHEAEAGRHAIGLARRLGIPILIDLEQVSPEAKEFTQNATYVVAPADVLMALTERATVETALRAILEQGPAAAVATAGARGSYGLCRQAAFCHVPAHPCRVVDTTGAGDAYHAGFGAAILKGFELEKAMEFGANVAAAKCEEPGPRISADRGRLLAQQLPGCRP